nr:hypothetical protein BaRGS_010929 [Batillaria attramentaria]
MLLAMSFNAWVMIAIVVGAGLGHFFIRPLFCHFVDLKLRKHLRKDSTAPPKCASKEETEKLRSGNEEAHFGCDDCMEKSLEPDGSTQDDSSSGDNEEEKQAFLSWDPVRQSRQFGVKGKETSV